MSATTESQDQDSKPARSGRGHVVVLGNEKGGSGKSTTALHLIVALLMDGWSVGSIDLDARQGTLTRYITNRRERLERYPNVPLPMPEHVPIQRNETASSRDAAHRDERERFIAALEQLVLGKDCVVIDTPGSDSFLARLGHACADTLITPLNDSFIDLDLLAAVDPKSHAIQAPSVYAEMVWEQRKNRAAGGGQPIDWVVMRNRLSGSDARNKRDMAQVLDRLAERLQFRLAPGFGERVVFRELFLKGLTLLDLGKRKQPDARMQMAHVAARQEVRSLLATLDLGTALEARHGAQGRTG